jgi:hypothetical protein
MRYACRTHSSLPQMPAVKDPTTQQAPLSSRQQASRSPPVRGKGKAHLSRPSFSSSVRLLSGARLRTPGHSERRPRGLPGSANLEQFKNGAPLDAQPGSPALAAFKRTDAQLVIARSFGFPSWPRLEAYLELTPRYSRWPANQLVGEHPNLRDDSYHSTPAGGAEHFGEPEAQRYLLARET